MEDITSFLPTVMQRSCPQLTRLKPVGAAVPMIKLHGQTLTEMAKLTCFVTLKMENIGPNSLKEMDLFIEIWVSISRNTAGKREQLPDGLISTVMERPI